MEFILLFFVGVFMLCMLAGLVRRPQPVERRSCPRCGHAVYALGPDDPCPSCRLARVRSANAACPRCKYDLRGSLEAAACPECGLASAVYTPPTAIEWSSRGFVFFFVVVTSFVAAVASVWGSWVFSHQVWTLARSIPGFREAAPSRIIEIHDSSMAAIGVVAAATCVGLYLTIMSIDAAFRRRRTAFLPGMLLPIAAWLGLALGVVIACFDRDGFHVRAGLWSFLGTGVPTVLVAAWAIRRALRPRSVTKEPT